MKWIKDVIGAFIAILLIGIIATNVYDMTLSKGVNERHVDLTVYTDDSVDISNSDLNFINDYYEYFISYTLTPEIVNGTYFGSPRTINDINLEKNIDQYDITRVRVTINVDTASSVAIESLITLSLNNVIVDNPTLTGYFKADTDYTISLYFEVPQPPVISGVTATLLTLIPLIFITGIIYFAYQRREI